MRQNQHYRCDEPYRRLPGSGRKEVRRPFNGQASGPINLYGATKLASDKLFVAGNSYAGADRCRFAVVRYGNVMGSRGSVIPLFLSMKTQGRLDITDPRMTRFMITLEQGVALVWHAFEDLVGGEICQKDSSMRVTDIAHAIAPDAEQRIIESARRKVARADDRYRRRAAYLRVRRPLQNYPGHSPMVAGPIRIKDGRKVAEDFLYTSDRNSSWMERIRRDWISKSAGRIGTF